MRWMGGWTWADLMEAPLELVEEIVAMMTEEIERRET